MNIKKHKKAIFGIIVLVVVLSVSVFHLTRGSSDTGGIEVQNLSVDASDDDGKEVMISVEVSNTGNEEETKYITFEVGSITKGENVDIEPGETKIVTKTLTLTEFGTYEVTAGGMSKSIVIENSEKKVGTGTSVGKKAPNFNFSTLKGENLSLKDFRGKVVVLDFMATWCPPCKEQIDQIKEIKTAYGESEVAILSMGIDPSESEEDLKDFKTNFEAEWKFTQSPEQGTEYGISAIPTLLIIDKEGIIRFRESGLTRSSKISSVIEEYS